MEKQIGVFETTKAEKQKAALAKKLRDTSRIIKFKEAIMLQLPDGSWDELNNDKFANFCYQKFGTALSHSRISDLQHYVFSSSPDKTAELSHFIRMGDKVWDMDAVDFTDKIAAEDCVYSTVYGANESAGKSQFILDLACGDESVYDDILQSMAPLIMARRPTGVIWWRGAGANGKSVLSGMIHKIFDTHIADMTIKTIEENRDTISLSGKLANVVRESSEAYIEDSINYKRIGTHEPFPAHVFYSQYPIMISGDMHHIQSTNNIPTFGDKSDGARRRTLIIPFDNKFEENNDFAERMLNDQKELEDLLGLIIQYAKRLKKQHYKYVFSTRTQETKARYDVETNSAETYVKELISTDIVGFTSYTNLYSDYENWCNDNGYYCMRKGVLRRAAEDQEFNRTTFRDGGVLKSAYVQGDNTWTMLEHVAGRLGLYRLVTSDAEPPQSSTETLSLGGW